MFYAIPVLLCISMHSSCSLRHRSPENLVQFVENPENRLRKAVTVVPCVFTFQYKPAAYILGVEQHPGGVAEKSRRQALDSMVWFNVTIQISGYNGSPLQYAAGNMAEYQARLNYYLNDAGRDFSLICGNDSLPASAYWFEDHQGLAPVATMIAGFRLRQAATIQYDLQIAYYDRVFRSGIIKTRIKVKDILNIPGAHQ